MSALPSEADIRAGPQHVSFGPILLKKSKIERLQKSRAGRLFGLSAAARLFKTITGIRGCVCANRFGPSRRRAWNASAVLKNLVRRPKRTFSTWGNSGIEPDKGKGISSPGTYEARPMWPCNDGERQWNTMSDWTCR